LTARNEVHHGVSNTANLLFVDGDRTLHHESHELIDSVGGGGRQFIELILHGKNDQSDDAPQDANHHQ